VTTDVVTGSSFGATSLVVRSVADSPPVVSPPDGTLTTDRFGFFGAAVASDVSEPDFLAFTVVVGFLSVVLLTLSGEVSSPPAESAGPVLNPATSAPEGTDGPVVSDAPDSEFEADEPCDAPDEEDVEDESDDPESVVSAHATPGVLATATPTPSAIASPPTRPM
jgi:hypothetical protein